MSWRGAALDEVSAEGPPSPFSERPERSESLEPPEPLVRPRERVYVSPGGFSVARTPTAISTVLGSCVSVCLWDPEHQIGGLNHFLLPHWSEGGVGAWRYGNTAVDGLIEALVAYGARLGSLQAKLFGGARVLSALPGAEGHLGRRNAEVAEENLRRRGIPIVSSAVGGERGRKVIFHTDDGSAWVKLL